MPFSFKHFFIDDTNTPMKVGIDGVLLGAYAEIQYNANVIDVGAGSGLVSLIIAQKFADAKISAIEINPQAFNDCNKNVMESPWRNRMEAINGDFISYDFSRDFDLVISNPPFFESGRNKTYSGRRIARMNDYLPLNLFFKKARSILSTSGEIIIIYPFDQRFVAIKSALLNGIFLKKELQIRDNDKADYKRSILHFSQSNDVTNIDISTLSIKEINGGYSHKFKVLTNDIYL